MHTKASLQASEGRCPSGKAAQEYEASEPQCMVSLAVSFTIGLYLLISLKMAGKEARMAEGALSLVTGSCAVTQISAVCRWPAGKAAQEVKPLVEEDSDAAAHPEGMTGT